jgi:hypothetical protein
MIRAASFLFVSFVYFVVSLSVRAQAPLFVPHDINPASEFPACGVMDVNHDGKLDIVSGGFWYEAPAWKKHFLREVEVIRGRFDDYSNLEMDVNADGWTDIISVNYRSASLFWIEHPGEKIKSDPETPWIKHLIDNPGPMETGRLYDIDGDGKLDILPNGTTFAGWYELIQNKTADGKVEPKFVKHDLPIEVAGHGVGFGDINGDGRGDIIGPHGWLEAPEDRRTDRWQWHPEWDLTKDASIPTLVTDVDGDGDNDLIWGRGHRYGLYWLEQGKAADGKRSWTWRAIDTSWAQPHSIFLADLDGDKKPELVAGKRYMGHEGKDPGEYDLLCAYSYKFNPSAHTWLRNTIYFNDRAAISLDRKDNEVQFIHRAGFGLDPKAMDIDGDGDLDLVAADRSSLCLLENVGVRTDSNSVPAQLKALLGPTYDHQRPALIDTRINFGQGSTRDAKSPAEYALRRNDIQLKMQVVMGALPESTCRVPLDVKIVADRLHEILSAKRPAWNPESPKTPSADLTGRWDVHIEFAAGSSDHTLHVKQQGNQLVGTHQGDFVSRDFSGTIWGDEVQISSNIGEVHGAALSYRFSGRLSSTPGGDTMSGTLDLGEYLGAKWTARRHAFAG